MILVDFDGFRGISGVFGAAISRGDLSSILVNFVDFGQFCRFWSILSILVNFGQQKVTKRIIKKDNQKG